MSVPRRLGCAVALLLHGVAAQAQAQDAARHELTAPDVAAFIDGYLPTEMERAGINA